MKRIFVAAAMGLFSSTLSSAHASEVTLSSKIKISYLGVNVGKMTNTVRITDTAYAVTGSAKTNGAVKVVARTSANFTSWGSLIDGWHYPAKHQLTYSTRKRNGSVNMNFASGKMTGSVSVPAVVYKAGVVPLQSDHMKLAFDPVSTLLFPVKAAKVGQGSAVCNRTVGVFDGKTRFNLVFSYKRSSNQSADGFRGKVFHCAVRYQPVSGYRPFKSDVKFLKANKDLEVSMARIGKSSVYGLFGFRVRTESGLATGRASLFRAQ